MPIAESNVRETMNSTSNRIDDPTINGQVTRQKFPGMGNIQFRAKDWSKYCHQL